MAEKPLDHDTTPTLLTRCVEAFQHALQAGLTPRLEDFLPQAPSREAVLVELVHAELDYLLKAGQPARVETYLERFPALADHPAIVQELLAAEYTLRRRVEPGLSWDEYQRRFPLHAPEVLARVQQKGEGSRPEGQTSLSGGEGSPARSAHTDAVAPALLPAPQLPDYQMLGEIGRGAVGVVYRARQLSCERVVAIKMLLPWQADAESLHRFRIEVRALAALQHPNIVQVYEAGQVQGLPYFTMEFVEGETLAERINGQPQPAPWAAGLVETLARAVHFAHQQGIIHRDLKPSNVFLTPAGEPRIGDFGLALLQRGDLRATRTGQIIGTPAFMAPEQANGQARVITTAADVYGLGALLYAACTGQAPFQGASREDVLILVRDREPLPPRQLQPNLPRDLATICLKCLRKEPEERYGSAEQLADDLHRFLTGQPIHARPVGMVERVGKWARRHRVTATLLSLCFFLLLALPLVLVWHTLRLQEVLDVARQERDRAVRSEAEARDMAYAADVYQAQQLCAHGDIFSLPALLDRYLPRDGSVDRRGFEWWYLQRQRQQPRPALRAHSGRLTLLSCTPDGRHLITAGFYDDLLKVWRRDDLATQTQPRPCYQLPLLPHVWYPSRTAALSPDGSILAVIDPDSRVSLYRTATGERLPGRSQSIHLLSLAFSADGLHLYACGDAPIHRWRIRSHGLELDATAPQDSGGQLHLLSTSDNQTLLCVERDRGLSLWDARTLRFQRRQRPGQLALALGESRSGNAVGVVSGGPCFALWDSARQTVRTCPPARPPLGLISLALADDGRSLAAGAVDGTLQLWDLPARQPPRNLRWQGIALWNVVFAPDGELFAASEDGLVHRLDTNVPPLFEAVRPTIEAGNALAFSPDGKTLAIADERGRVQLVEARGRRLLRTLGPTTAKITQLSFRPDGQTLAVIGEDGLELWDVRSGKQLSCSLEGAQEVASAVFAPDGASLLVRTRLGEIIVCDPVHGRQQDRLAAHALVGPVVSADGRRVAAGCRDHRVRVWSLKAGRLGREAHATESLGGPPTCLALSPDGRTLLAGTSTGPTLAVWQVDDTGGLKAAAPLALEVLDRAANLVFAPNSQTVFCRLQNGLVFFLDVPGRTVRHALLGPDEKWCRCGALSPDGRRLAAISQPGEVIVWDTASWEVQPRPPSCHGPVRALAFTPDGRQLLASAAPPGGHTVRTEWTWMRYDRWMTTSNTDGLRTWDTGGNERWVDLPSASIVGWTTLFAFSPDTRLVAASSTDGSIWLWDRQEQRLLGRHFLDPSEELLALSHQTARQRVPSHLPLSDRIVALAFSPDNRLLAVLQRDGAVTLREASTWQERGSLPPADRRFVAFSPDGKRLATNAGGQVQLRDVPTLSLLASQQEETASPILCGCFSADGKRLALGTEDRTVKLWDCLAGGVRELRGHQERVSAVAFTPDGRTLASGGWDRTVRLWNVAAGQEVATLEAHAGKVRALVFSPSGRLLASGGDIPSGGQYDGEVFFWRADSRAHDMIRLKPSGGCGSGAGP
jgi:WD40 repeat protein